MDILDQKQRFLIVTTLVMSFCFAGWNELLNNFAVEAASFTGAEIEQAVVSAMYSASARTEEVTQKHIADAIQKTQPLSVVMAERIHELRAWAHERAVFAN